MSKLITLLALLIILAGLIAFTINRSTAAERNYSRAAIILAKGESRQDTAVAMLPYAVIAASVATGLTVVATGLTLFLTRQSNDSGKTPHMVERIETRTIILLPSQGMSRREIYRIIGGATEVKRLGSGNDG